MKVFHPVLPPPWRVLFGQDGADPRDPRVAIELSPDLCWYEDLYDAVNGEWSIWLDGGKKISAWQCSLIKQRARCPETDELPAPVYIMRDFLDTPEQVQQWIDRAVRVQKLYTESV